MTSIHERTVKVINDTWIKIKIGIDDVRKNNIKAEIVESAARILVNKGRIFRFILFIVVIVLIFIAIAAAFLDNQTSVKAMVEKSNNENLLLSEIKESTERKAAKKFISYLQDDEQKQRRKTVTNVCKRALNTDGSMSYLKDELMNNFQQNIQPSMFSQLYVDDKRKVIYCEIPKVACTNFKRIMLIISGKMNTTDPMKIPSSLVHHQYETNYLRKLSTYTPKQIASKLSQYFKFMFVREPLERTLSAYMNKFTKYYNDYFKVRFGKTIIKRYRKNPSKISLETGKDVTFVEFVKYLTDPVTQKQDDLNEHWKQYYKLCHPCQVKYDFIGKYETLDQDVGKILNILKLSDAVHFPAGRNGVSTSDLTKQYFNNVTSQDIHSLWKLYSVDYSMFGYKYPNFR